MDDHEIAVEHLQRLGAHFSPRQISSGLVLGIQCRDRRVADADLVHVEAFRELLDVIGLAGTDVTDEGLKHLCNLPKLDNVNLTDTAISDAGLELLSEIKTLEYVHVEGTRVTRNGVERLQRELPNCEIVWDGG